MAGAIRIRVRFLPEVEGGRRTLPSDLLSCGTYRPHIVVGEEMRALVNEAGVSTEDYLGIVFIAQTEPLFAGQEIEAEITKAYPNVDYSLLTQGAMFTVREGASIVATGHVL